MVLLIIPAVFANQLAPHDHRIGDLKMVKLPPAWVGPKVVERTLVQQLDRRVARQNEITLSAAKRRIDRGQATFISGGADGQVDVGDTLNVTVRGGGTWKYVLGTDKQGRDVLSRIIHGSKCHLKPE